MAYTDKVGASPIAMAAAVTHFNRAYGDFVTASQNITQDTLDLQASWQGAGYNSFTEAMGGWNKDITNVTTDLQSMSLTVNSSSDAILQTDQNIARAFAQHHK
jgi:WXG100 family type VII secretion target